MIDATDADLENVEKTLVDWLMSHPVGIAPTFTQAEALKWLQNGGFTHIYKAENGNVYAVTEMSTFARAVLGK